MAVKDEAISRLRWACRRGMLELDVLLGKFLEQAYPSLSPEEKKSFENLLDSQDTDLIAWLLGYEKPHQKEMVKIVERIRHHARTQF